jgi:hypothetical protein
MERVAVEGGDATELRVWIVMRPVRRSVTWPSAHRLTKRATRDLGAAVAAAGRAVAARAASWQRAAPGGAREHPTMIVTPGCGRDRVRASSYHGSLASVFHEVGGVGWPDDARSPLSWENAAC